MLMALIVLGLILATSLRVLEQIEVKINYWISFLKWLLIN